MGENITKEWDKESNSDDLLKATLLLKRNVQSGISLLHSLSNQGSTLAKVYLGSFHLNGSNGFEKNETVGENFLMRSVEEGSLEGAFILAYHFLTTDRKIEALNIYEKLSRLDYSPAQYVLGRIFLNGEFFEIDKEKAKNYLRLASVNGHYYARKNLCDILIYSGETIFDRFAGIFNKILLICPFVYKKIKYPNSDAFRF